jgi:hypothetical protein
MLWYHFASHSSHKVVDYELTITVIIVLYKMSELHEVKTLEEAQKAVHEMVQKQTRMFLVLATYPSLLSQKTTN